jgi:hypothetical protein
MAPTIRPVSCHAFVISLLASIGGLAHGQARLDTTLYEPLNDSFQLTVTEYLLPPFRLGDYTGPQLYLQATSHRKFGCPVGLGMTIHSTQDRIDVYIAGVPRESQTCSAIIAPASNSVRLPVQARVYDLVVRRPDGMTDTYRLHLTDSLTEAIPLTTRYTTLAPARRWRARRNTLSMTCTLPMTEGKLDSTQAWVCIDFARWLEDSLGMRPFRFAEGPAKPFLDPPPQQWGDVQYYEYRRPVDFRRSYKLLQRFGKVHIAPRAPNASIMLTNWRGARISSYICRPDQHSCQPDNAFTPW